MSDKWLSAVFWIPKGEEQSPPDRLLAACGAQLSSLGADDLTGLREVEWAGLFARATIVELPYHKLLKIFIRQTDFLELVEIEPDQHPIVRQFCHCCRELGAEVAFVLTHLDQAEPERILDTEWMVLSRDANVLVRERFGLLYLDRSLASEITVPVGDRDRLACGDGMLVFSHAGDKRWY